MTPKQQMLHKMLIKQLHISKRYTEYYKHNKEEYKDMLEEFFGVRSSLDLRIEQLIDLVDYMNFKKASLVKSTPELCSKAQQVVIRELWGNIARDKSDEALLTFIQRVLKKRYLHLHMLTKKEAQVIIPVLKSMNNV